MYPNKLERHAIETYKMHADNVSGLKNCSSTGSQKQILVHSYERSVHYANKKISYYSHLSASVLVKTNGTHRHRCG